MRPKYHILIGFIVSIIFYFFFSIEIFEVSILFLSSFLIDFDHYIYYIFRTKNFSLKKAYYWYLKKEKQLKKLSKRERKKVTYAFYVFHGFEWILVFFLLGYFVWDIFYFVTIGIFLHLFTDIMTEIIKGERVFKISVLLDLMKRKKLKKI
jgi:hypothetical protein